MKSTVLFPELGSLMNLMGQMTVTKCMVRKPQVCGGLLHCNRQLKPRWGVRFWKCVWRWWNSRDSVLWPRREHWALEFPDDIPGSYLSRTVLWYCGHNHRAISHSYFIDLNNNPLTKWGAYHYTHNRVEKIETQEAFMIYRKPHSLELRT